MVQVLGLLEFDVPVDQMEAVATSRQLPVAPAVAPVVVVVAAVEEGGQNLSLQKRLLDHSGVQSVGG